MRGGTKKSAGRTKPGKATSKPRAAPATRGRAATTGRVAVAGKKASVKPRPNRATPDRALAKIRAELAEARAQQTATAEILEIINRSSGDPAPVFDAILKRAMRLCDAAFGGLLVPDGEFVKYLTFHNVPQQFVDFLTRHQVRPRTMFSPTWETGGVVNIADLSRTEAYRRRIPVTVSAVEDGGIRAMLLVPMTRKGAFVGAFTIYRQEVRPFTDRQVALAHGFAAQAAIAMENARLLGELNARNGDLTQSLERQTATSEILRAIAASPGDAEGTLKKIAETTAHLFGATGVSFRIAEGDEFKLFIGVGRGAQEVTRKIYDDPARRLKVSDPGLPGRVITGNRQIHVPDLDHLEPEMASWPGLPIARAAGTRTMVGTPLRSGGRAVGAVLIYRDELRPFDDVELQLVQSFADQAVIAIENARLLSELRQSLDRQTATAEVLQVINSSPGDVAPVFDAILEKAHTLCGAARGSLFLIEGDSFHAAATRGYPDDMAAGLRRSKSLAQAPPFRALIAGRRMVHQPDLLTAVAEDDLVGREVATRGGIRTNLLLPLRKDETLLGIISCNRLEVRPFTDKEIELLESFAAQAVIAIENARLLTELRESLDRQTAMSEVLGVISASPGQVQPVFEKMLECALRLCRAHMGTINQVTDGGFTEAARIGAPSEFAFRLDNYRPPPDTPLARLLARKSTIRIDDYSATEGYAAGTPAIVALVDLGRARSAMQVPMVKDGEVVGAMTIYRPEVNPFDDRDATIAEDFAKQAVIAIENARLLSELHRRTADLQESLEYQTATSDVLKVISRTTFDLEPVLQYVLETALRLCQAPQGSIFRLDGEVYRWAVGKDLNPTYEEIERNTPIEPGEGTIVGRAALRRQTVQIVDAWEDPAYAAKDDARITLARTMLGVPLLREGVPIGVIAMARKVVEPFKQKEIDLVTTFADQAVIAIENARLLNELQSRQAELRVTFDNMGDAVIMFDGAQRLVAWNRNFLHMLDIPETWPATPRTFADMTDYLTARGEFGDMPPPDMAAPSRDGEVRPIRYERTRPNGRVLEVRRNPIPGGAGFVFIYSDITERKLAEQSILAAREAAEHALADLKLAQANLVQSEKMASLGALTAGIAHEIKNPLNFVNNFASLSHELLDELKETAAPAFATLDADKRDEIDETMTMLAGNLEKIQEHGKRADGIVKSMLAHSRGGSGDRREADVNALVEESLNLAYHGARAQDQNFNITLERDYDKAMKPIELVPQDVTRVFLNLCGNGFYAANKRRKDGGNDAFRPMLKVATRDLGDVVEVRIRDNGIGIPPDIKDKLFQPFFTTKPTGEGTGLGLSISYDIVTQQHGGTIAVDSAVGDFTEFTIRLPRKR
jgi:GAF domain-containing protein/signal transduction histidine kinase